MSESKSRKPYHTKTVQEGLERLAKSSPDWSPEATEARIWIFAMSEWRVQSPQAQLAGRERSVSESAPGAVLAIAPGEETEQ